MTKTTTKEDSDTKFQRQKSADEEEKYEEATTQRGPDLSETGDGDDGEGGGGALVTKETTK